MRPALLHLSAAMLLLGADLSAAKILEPEHRPGLDPPQPWPQDPEIRRDPRPPHKPHQGKREMQRRARQQRKSAP